MRIWTFGSRELTAKRKEGFRVSVRRRLDQTEKVLSCQRADSPVTVEYRGELNLPALKKAFEKLCTRHPILRARIFHDGEEPAVEVSDSNSPPEFLTLDGDLTDLIQYFGQWPNSSSYIDGRDPNTRALARLIVVRRHQHGYVTLSVDHTLIDGASQFEFLHQLWEFYTRISTGLPVIVDKMPLPSAPSEILRERHPGFLNSSFRNHTKEFKTWNNLWKSSGFEIGDADVCMVRLSASDTARLTSISRKNGLSVNSLTIGIMAASLCSYFSEQGECKQTIEVFTLVGLRKYIEPRVLPTEVTSLSAPFKTTVASSADPIALARQFADSLAAAIDQNDLTVLDSEESLRPMFDADLTVNNLGRTQSFVTPDTLQIIDYFPLRYRNRMTKWGAGRQRLGLASWTYNDKLTMVINSRIGEGGLLKDQVSRRLMLLDSNFHRTALNEEIELY